MDHQSHLKEVEAAVDFLPRQLKHGFPLLFLSLHGRVPLQLLRQLPGVDVVHDEPQVVADCGQQGFLFGQGLQQSLVDVLEEEGQVILFGVADRVSHFLFEDFEQLGEFVVPRQLVLDQLHLLAELAEPCVHLVREVLAR